MKFIFAVLAILTISAYTQTETHKWKTLSSSPQLLWYDASQLDTITTAPFEIWIIELNKPPLTLDGVSGKVNRSKTLYVVDKKNERYGIKKVVYYDNAMKEVGRYEYSIPGMQEEMKYPFPIMKNSFLQKLFSEIEKKRKLNE